MVKSQWPVVMDKLSSSGESTHTLVPCWMIAILPPRNQCMGCFAPALSGSIQHIPRIESLFKFRELSTMAIDFLFTPIEEILGHNRLRSWCFRVQPVTR